MKTLEVDGVKYRLTRLDAGVIPFIQLYQRLSANPPKDVKEAKKRAEELQAIMDEIFAMCIDPQPRPEHRWAVFIWLMDRIAEAGARLTGLEKFRQEQGG